MTKTIISALAIELLKRLRHENADTVVSYVENGSVLDEVEHALDKVSDGDLVFGQFAAMEAEDTLTLLRAARERYGKP